MELRFSKASGSSFLEKAFQVHWEGEAFHEDILRQLQFTVRHYAGPVSYSAPGLLEKNKDRLRFETLCLLADSSRSKLFKSRRQILIGQNGRCAVGRGPVSRQAKEQTGGREASSRVLIVDFWTFELSFSRHSKFWIISRCRQPPIKNCRL